MLGSEATPGSWLSLLFWAGGEVPSAAIGRTIGPPRAVSPCDPRRVAGRPPVQRLGLRAYAGHRGPLRGGRRAPVSRLARDQLTGGGASRGASGLTLRQPVGWLADLDLAPSDERAAQVGRTKQPDFLLPLPGDRPGPPGLATTGGSKEQARNSPSARHHPGRSRAPPTASRHHCRP
jgi:hypothetical protein